MINEFLLDPIFTQINTIKVIKWQLIFIHYFRYAISHILQHTERIKILLLFGYVLPNNLVDSNLLSPAFTPDRVALVAVYHTTWHHIQANSSVHIH